MNIAMFTDTWETDGVSHSIRRAKMGLEARGHRVFVFAPTSSKKRGWCGDIYFLGGMSFPLYPTYRLCIAPKNLCDEVEEKKIDVVHVHTPAFLGVKGMMAAERLGLPSVYTAHGDSVEDLKTFVTCLPPFLLEKLGRMYMRIFLKSVDVMIFPSDATFDATSSWIPSGIRVATVPTGVDLDLFFPSRFPPSLVKQLQDEGKKVVLSVGRISQDKNLPLLFEIIDSMCEDYSLVVIGGGHKFSEYREDWASDRIHFVGKVSDEDLVRYYSFADCFAIVSRTETQGMVVQEAMACGCPVVALDVPPLNEFIEDGYNGFLVSEEEIVSGIVRACARRKKLKLNTLRTAYKYSIGGFIDALEKVYKSVL